MGDHRIMKMCHADRQVKDNEMIKAMLDLCPVCTLAIHDEPYPYEVPINFGYCWEDKLILYMHMASEGYKMSLLQKNPYVSCNTYAFVDRSLGKKYRNERQDYRSVTVFGKAEILTCKQPEEFLKGLNALNAHYKRETITHVPKMENLVVLKIVADVITAKAMYPIEALSEVPMPQNEME